MSLAASCATIRRVGIVPVIRVNDADMAVKVAGRLLDAGLPIAEITLTVPNAIDAIAAASEQFGDRMLIGAGTVVDAETARAVVSAGATFVVSPCLAPGVIEVCSFLDVAVMTGALTPTEVFEAVRRGTDFVKIFPVEQLGGAAYIRALRGPFPGVGFVPTGGVTLATVGGYLAAGASAVGVGGELVSGDAVERGDYDAIRDNAIRFVAAVKSARAG